MSAENGYGMDNPYRPERATVLNVQLEAGGGRPIKTLKVQIDDEKIRKDFHHKPGQFLIASCLGVGESVFAINSAPNSDGILEFSAMKVGNVTTRLHELAPGDSLGIRGPFGNSFPVEDWKGKNIVFIGAGIGVSPVRSVYDYVIAPENRKDYGDVTIIYGARTPADLVYKTEFKALEERDDLDVWLCIDWQFGPQGPIEASSAGGWPAINMGSPGDTEIPVGVNKFTCFVPQLVEVVKPSPENTIVVTCGPPIAIKFISIILSKLGFTDEQVYTTLENRMKCGIGKCGRCNIGHIYVCKQGPVFTNKEVKKMLPEF
ncbi:MAG: FAD/NAD(P)-binding protein [Thermoplasmata archaeon]|nr:FAD/NAD(P)-binding protein [Thermoplasmata archaeon]